MNLLQILIKRMAEFLLSLIPEYEVISDLKKLSDDTFQEKWLHTKFDMSGHLELHFSDSKFMELHHGGNRQEYAEYLRCLALDCQDDEEIEDEGHWMNEWSDNGYTPPFSQEQELDEWMNSEEGLRQMREEAIAIEQDRQLRLQTSASSEDSESWWKT